MSASAQQGKCAKCNTAAIKAEGVNLRFHRFPLPGKHGCFKARVWAEYCYPGENWSTEKLRSLHQQHKMLCSKHFDDGSYTSSSKIRLNNFAIPIGTESIMLKLHREESSVPKNASKTHHQAALWHAPSVLPAASSTGQDPTPSTSKDAIARAALVDLTTNNCAQAALCTPPVTSSNIQPLVKLTGVCKQVKARQPTASTPNQAAAKRSRPEDTLMSSGNQKCARARPSQITRSSTATAAAIKANKLCVAVMTEPFQDLSADQAKVLYCYFFSKMEEDYLNPALDEQMVNVGFQGKTHHSEGVLKFWCKTDSTLVWLCQVVADLPSPIAGTTLVVQPQSQIPRRLLCGLKVPMSEDGVKMQIDHIRRILDRANKNYNVGSWNLIKHEWQTLDNLLHVFLLLRIPEKEVATIFAEERKVTWIMGTIYLWVLDGTGAVAEAMTTDSAQKAQIPPADEANTQLEPAQPTGTMDKGLPSSFIKEEEVST